MENNKKLALLALATATSVLSGSAHAQADEVETVASTPIVVEEVTIIEPTTVSESPAEIPVEQPVPVQPVVETTPVVSEPIPVTPVEPTAPSESVPVEPVEPVAPITPTVPSETENSGQTSGSEQATTEISESTETSESNETGTVTETETTTEVAPYVSPTNPAEPILPPENPVVAGEISEVTGQVVETITPEQPVVIKGGYKVVATDSGRLVIQNLDGTTALVSASELGGKLNEDGTISIQKTNGEMVTLPHTGEEEATFLVALGLMILAFLGFSTFKENKDNWNMV